MLKRPNLYLLIVSSIAIIDLLSKEVALHNFKTLNNAGLFLGIGQNFFQSSLVLFLGLLGILFFSTYIFFLMNLGAKYHKVKLALSFLVGGIIGNITDRLLRGVTTDFIPGYKSSFNFADIAIFCSVLYLIYLTLSKRHNIFFERNFRKILIINKKEQFRLANYFAISSFLTSLLLGVFIYTFFKFIEIIDPDTLHDFVLLYGILTILSTIYFFIFGLILSNKSIGALYAFERYIEQIIQGEDKEFKLRENDDFKHLEELAEQVRQKIHHE